jgi:hypothetical protein
MRGIPCNRAAAVPFCWPVAPRPSHSQVQIMASKIERAIHIAIHASELLYVCELHAEPCVCDDRRGWWLPDDILIEMSMMLEDVADLRRDAKRGPRRSPEFIEARLKARSDEIKHVRTQRGLQSDDAARDVIAQERGISVASLKKAEQRDRRRLREAKGGHN